MTQRGMYSVTTELHGYTDASQPIQRDSKTNKQKHGHSTSADRAGVLDILVYWMGC